jgi:hypothetical protein
VAYLGNFSGAWRRFRLRDWEEIISPLADDPVLSFDTGFDHADPGQVLALWRGEQGDGAGGPANGGSGRQAAAANTHIAGEDEIGV